ncbi:MAG: DUF4010 domain-containing protein [Steroidobacteraceae bacterium]
MEPIELAGRLGLALAMAIFIGVAFEEIYKRDAPSNPGGIRTFPMLALLGSMLFLLEPKSMLAFIVGMPGVAAWLYARIRAAPADQTDPSSLVIPTANLLAYSLGPIAITQPPWVIVAASVTAVLLLESREALHALVRTVPREEVFTLGKFLILVGLILPLVPNHPVVSWTPITPFQAWLALVAISTLSYISYLLQRYVPRTRSLLPAVLGGIYSSTATTVALARQQKQSGVPNSRLSAGIVTATSIMYLRIGIVVAIFNAQLALLLLPALVGLFLVGAVLAAFEWNRASTNTPTKDLPATNPLQLPTAVTFAAMFVIIALASAWVRARYGQTGVLGLAAISGATDVDPFVLSLAQGSVTGMTLHALAAAILIAAASNNVLKALYAVLFGSLKACGRPAVLLLALAVLGIAVAASYLR